MTKLLKLVPCDFQRNVALCPTCLPAKFDYEIRRCPLDQGTPTIGWGGFSRTLQLQCHKMLSVCLSVVSLSVKQVHFDKMTEVGIMRSSLKCSEMP